MVVHYNEQATKQNVDLECDVVLNGEDKTFKGQGTGIVDAFSKCLNDELGVEFDIVDYSQHSMSFGKKSKAITYVQIYDKDQNSYFGIGFSSNIAKSSLRAIVSAVNKMNK
jgi:2-isopropylmalate synthase